MQPDRTDHELLLHVAASGGSYAAAAKELRIPHKEVRRRVRHEQQVLRTFHRLHSGSGVANAA